MYCTSVKISKHVFLLDSALDPSGKAIRIIRAFVTYIPCETYYIILNSKWRYHDLNESSFIGRLPNCCTDPLYVFVARHNKSYERGISYRSRLSSRGTIRHPHKLHNLVSKYCIIGGLRFALLDRLRWSDLSSGSMNGAQCSCPQDFRNDCYISGRHDEISFRVTWKAQALHIPFIEMFLKTHKNSSYWIDNRS